MTQASTFAVLMGMSAVPVSAQSVPGATSKTNSNMTLPEVDISAVSTNVSPAGETFGVITPPKKFELGPAGNQKPLDMPHSVQVISQEIIRSQQARNLADVLKFNPSVQMSRGADGGRISSRGFESGVVQNTRMDGLNMISTTGYPIEQFDRIEMLNGVAGGMYGPTGPTGTFNFISKRPTDVPFQTISYGYDSISNNTVFGDVGDRVEGLAFRFNFVHSGGQSYAPTSSLRRTLLDGAIDLHFGDSTVLELNGSYYDWHWFGFPGSFTYGNGIYNLPQAPSSSTAGFGVPGMGNQNETHTFSAKLKHEFNQDWNLTIGLLDQTVERGLYQPTNVLNNNYGQFTSQINSQKAAKFTIISNLATLNGHVMTGNISHDIFVGTTGFTWGTFSGIGTNSVTVGTANINNPFVFATPIYQTGGAVYKSARNDQQSLVGGDTIKFDEHWSLSLNSSFSWLTSKNYNALGQKTSSFQTGGEWSPTASVMYKPSENQTAYFTYANSLQQGDTAPTGTLNANQTLAPYRSTQYELGYKVALNDRFMITADGFRISQPWAYQNADKIYQNFGTQVNWGSEVMLTGQLTDDLSMMGGFMQLVPKLFNTGTPGIEGKDVVNIPRVQANLFLEYTVPTIQGLALSTNFHYVGGRPGNETNTIWSGAYATLDFGLRYTTVVDGHRITARFNVNNVTDKSYWTNIYPVSGVSTSAGSQAYLGLPRTFSAGLDFTL
ncbi:TonB-dependent receptor [Beijerinckia indica]|uniref:TonB-dependent receptor n=1 Tax=Beijerinckia indica TaxID=533 RepID=UPI0006830085|nr:TonB-dependent receptor [Beijerinckia indica]